MWKTTFTLFTILVAAIGGLLFWQWDAYSKQKESPNGKIIEKANQQITIEAKNSNLHITQTISHLTDGKAYRVTFPDSIKKWSCVQKDEKPCETKGKDSLSFIAKNGTLRFKMSVAIDKNKKALLLNDWSGSFPDVTIAKTTIEITDHRKKKGSWVTGFPLKGHNEQDLIDYYVFEGERSISSLYWQQSPLYNKQGPRDITYYSPNKKDKHPSDFPSLKKLADFSSLAIVMTNEFSDRNGKGIIITKASIDNKILERKIVKAYFENRFTDLSLEEEWLLDVFTSLVTNQKSNVSKGDKLIKELKTNLDKDQLKHFLDQVIKDSEPLTPKRLDQLLGDLNDKGTHFFTLNKNESNRFVPLFYFDKRKVYVKDRVQKEIEIIFVNEERLFPFKETMEALGFDVKVLSDKETLLLNKGNNSYRFYVKRNFFIYNEEDYGLLENPLTNLNGKTYMKYQWLHELFEVSVEEDEKKVKLTSAE